MGKIAEFVEKRYSLADLDRDMESLLYGMPTFTGVKVSEAAALKNVPYFAGVRLISETVGQVPLVYYKRVMRGREPGRRGKERAVEDNLYWLMHEEPNPEMDAVSFKSALTGHAVAWGDAYAEIEWDMRAGEVKSLWPLDVSKVSVNRDKKTRELVYNYRAPDGVTYVLPAYRVWHMSAFGFNGITGYNNVRQGRESLGLTMALEEHGARFFANGARPGVVLQHPGQLSKEAKESNVRHWQEAYGGLSNVNRVAILDEGITLKEVGIPPATAQMLESRTFQIQEVARMLNVTPHKLMELSHATYSNIEHQDLEFLKYTMGIWFRRWEQASNRKLIFPGKRRLYFYEFLEDALLRADSAARAAFYKELFYLGSLSPNDIREKENMNPIADPNGDRYFMQQNMAPLDMVDEVLQKNRTAERYAVTMSLGQAVRSIAERESRNILRAAEREPETFGVWLEDFYRDFREYVRRQLEPVLGDEAAGYAEEYIKESRRRLSDVSAGDIEIIMDGWSESRSSIKQEGSNDDGIECKEGQGTGEQSAPAESTPEQG